MTRWATFDCYGTLIDSAAGWRDELTRLFGAGAAQRLLQREDELNLERQLEAEHPARSYREILALTLAGLAEAEGLELPDRERDALARSLPAWRPFPEVRHALQEARRRGWKLGVLSNTDRDLASASAAQIGVAFDETVVAEQIGAYKPAHRHWQAFFARTRADRARHVHVAASLFHDIAPARDLGLTTIWINRTGDHPYPQATRELPDLRGLPDTLDELIPPQQRPTDA